MKPTKNYIAYCHHCEQDEKARRDKMTELMGEYDKTVYYPARKALRERCEKVGHRWNFSDLNPVGYPIFVCNQCGATDIRKE